VSGILMLADHAREFYVSLLRAIGAKQISSIEIYCSVIFVILRAGCADS